MRIRNWLAATGLVLASLGASAAANAQGPHQRVVTVRTVHTRVVTKHRNGWHRPHCKTVWRHHRRVRRCG